MKLTTFDAAASPAPLKLWPNGTIQIYNNNNNYYYYYILS